MTINGQTLASDGSTVINTNSIEAVASYDDVDGQNRSGIDATATTIKIDGNEIGSDNSDTAATVRLTLQNGKHTMTVSVSDTFGNTVEKTMAFIVTGDTLPDAATVSVSGSDFVPLGSDYTLTVAADGKVKSADITLLNLNDDIGQPAVTYANGVTGKLEYTKTGFKKAMLTLHLESAAPVEGELATLTFKIDAGLDTSGQPVHIHGVQHRAHRGERRGLYGGPGGGASAAVGILQHPARPAGGRHVQRDRSL